MLAIYVADMAEGEGGAVEADAGRSSCLHSAPAGEADVETNPCATCTIDYDRGAM